MSIERESNDYANSEQTRRSETSLPSDSASENKPSQQPSEDYIADEHKRTQQRIAEIEAILAGIIGRKPKSEETDEPIISQESEYQPSLTGYRISGIRPPIDSGHALAGSIGLAEGNRRDMSKKMNKYVLGEVQKGNEHSQSESTLSSIASSENNNSVV